MSGGEFRLGELSVATGHAAVESAGWRGWLRVGENGLLVAILGCMLLLPLLEVLRRWGLPVGVQAAESWLAHCNLLVGVVGGMIAAREGRLLALSTLPNLFPKPWQRHAAGMVAGSSPSVLDRPPK